MWFFLNPWHFIFSGWVPSMVTEWQLLLAHTVPVMQLDYGCFTTLWGVWFEGNGKEDYHYRSSGKYAVKQGHSNGGRQYTGKITCLVECLGYMPFHVLLFMACQFWWQKVPFIGHITLSFLFLFLICKKKKCRFMFKRQLDEQNYALKIFWKVKSYTKVGVM